MAGRSPVAVGPDIPAVVPPNLQTSAQAPYGSFVPPPTSHPVFTPSFQSSLAPVGSQFTDRASPSPMPGASGGPMATSTFNPFGKSDLANLDLKSFGLSNPPLQTALHAMLKAIVALSEDHKVVKHQVTIIEQNMKTAQDTLRSEMHEVKRHVGEDFITRKEWTEGRYDDQRRSDRVGESLHDLREHTMRELSIVVPKVSVLENQALTLQAETTRLSMSCVGEAEFKSSVSGLNSALATLTSNLERSTQIGMTATRQLSEELSQTDTRLQQHVAAGEVTRQQLLSAIDDVSKTQERWQRQMANAQEHLTTELLSVKEDASRQRVVASGNVQAISALEAAVDGRCQSLQSTIEQRLMALENRTQLFQTQMDLTRDDVTSFKKVTTGAVDSVTSELSGLHATIHDIDTALRRQMVDLQRTLESAVDGARDTSDAAKRSMALASHEFNKRVEDLRADFDIVKETLDAKFTNVEKRVRADLEATKASTSESLSEFEKVFFAKVVGETRRTQTERDEKVSANVGELSRQLAAFTATTTEGIGQVRSQIDTIVDRLSWSDERLEQDNIKVNSFIQSVRAELWTLLDLFGVDLKVVPKLESSSSSDLSSGGHPDETTIAVRRETLNRIVRSLPWFPKEPAQSPARRSPPRPHLSLPPIPVTFYDGFAAAFSAANSGVGGGRHDQLPVKSPERRPVTLPPTTLEQHPKSSAIADHSLAKASLMEGVPGAGDASPNALAPSTSYTPPSGIPITSGAGSGFRLGLEITETVTKVGVLVVKVDPKGAAFASGIAPGDVIVRVGDHPVTSQSDFLSALRSIPTQQALTIGVRITFISPLSDGNPIDVTVKGQER